MRRTGWRELKKRLLALGVAAVMVGNTVDLSVLPVMAMAQEQTVDMEAVEESENTEQSAVLTEDSENIELTEGTDLTEDSESTGENTALTENDSEEVVNESESEQNADSLLAPDNEEISVLSDETEEKCDHTDVDEASAVCRSCNAEIDAKIVQNSSTRYTEVLTNGDFWDGTVTLLRDNNIRSQIYTASMIDLNGHMMTGMMTVKANSDPATLTGMGTVDYIYLGDTDYGGRGGTLDIQKDNVMVGMLDVRLNGETKLSHGMFKQIITKHNGGTPVTAADLLAEGYAFYGKDEGDDYTVLQKMDLAELQNVKVLPHEHEYINGVCECGDECDVLLNGREKFDTIQAAANAIINSDTKTGTILLTKDVTENVTIDTAGAKITIDLGGHTWTADLSDGKANAVLTISGQSGPNASYMNESVVTLQNGNMIQGGSGGSGAAGGTAGAAIVMKSYSQLVLGENMMVVHGFTGTRDNCAAIDMSNNSSKKALQLSVGNVLIGGIRGYYLGSSSTYLPVWLPLDGAFVACDYDENTGTATSKPDEYVDLYSKCLYFGNISVAKHVSHTLDKGTCVCGYTCPHTNMTEDYYCPDCGQQFVAKYVNGNQKTIYTVTIEDALNSQKNSAEFVTMLSDVDVGDRVLAVTKNMYGKGLDMAGHKLSGSGEAVFQICKQYGFVVRNGTIENTGSGDAVQLTRVEGDWTGTYVCGNLTLENMNVTADQGWAVQVKREADKANLTITSGVFKGGLDAGVVYLGNKVQITSGTFVANPGTHSIYYPGSGQGVTGLVGQLKDLLVENRTYADENGNAIKYFDESNYTILDNTNVQWPAGIYLNADTVTIIDHTSHTINRETGTCEICGAPCPHIEWDADGICTACGIRVMFCEANGNLYPTIHKAMTAVKIGQITRSLSCWQTIPITSADWGRPTGIHWI